MKTTKTVWALALSAPLLLALDRELHALDEKPQIKASVELPQLPGVMEFPEIDGVFIQSGALFRFEQGSKVPVSGALSYGTGFEIQPDGTVMKSTSALWRLEEGQLFFPDGSLMLADGSMTYAEDHYVQQSGKLFSVRGGIQEIVPPGLQLPNGIVLKDYGRMIMPNGYVSVLQDGQVLRSNGEELPAWDTILFQNGKVTLFKDGSLLSLAPHRMMVMNDGTKVWGNGTISRRTRESNWDEVKVKLPEDAVVRIPRIPGAQNQRRAKQGY